MMQHCIVSHLIINIPWLREHNIIAWQFYGISDKVILFRFVPELQTEITHILQVIHYEFSLQNFQVYYVNPQGTSPNSPIYSLRFDSNHLYCATDRHLVELNFSDHLCQKNDYKKLYILYDKKSRGYR